VLGPQAMPTAQSRMPTGACLAALALASAFPQAAAQFQYRQAMTPADTPSGMVDCGGHFESRCSLCPAGNGPTWCNGDCAWLFLPGSDGQCVTKMGGNTNETYAYLFSALISGAIMLIYACVYKQKVIVGPPPLPKVNSIISGPRRGLFECFWYPDTCLYTTFCLPVVAAKNYYAADVCPFWPGCVLTFLGTYSPFYCLSVFARTVLSGRVQDKLGIRHNFCMDCLQTAFCFPCDVGRESLEVDREIGVEISCCCQVKITPRVMSEMRNFVDKESRFCTKYRICGGSGY